MKLKRSFGVFGDMHVGSAFAILPPNFKTERGNSVHMNPGQEQIYEYWSKAPGILKSWDVDTIILIGDLIQGLHYKRAGAFNILPELKEQKNAAEVLLKPLCKDRHVMGVSGTKYHDARDIELEQEIIKDLGGKYYGYVVNCDIAGTGRAMNVMHGKSKALVYRETSASRETLFFKEAEALGKLTKCDILLRAHNHFFLHIHRVKTHFVLNPCWQALVPDDYTMGNYAKWQPDIGFSIITIDSGDRVNVMHFCMEEQIHITDYVRKI